MINSSSFVSQGPGLISSIASFNSVLRYNVRHGVSNKRDLDCEPSSPSLPQLADGKYPFPICEGGAFMEIARRAQQNPEWLLGRSTALCYAAGFLDSNDPDDFVETYLTASDSYPK